MGGLGLLARDLAVVKRVWILLAVTVAACGSSQHIPRSDSTGSRGALGPRANCTRTLSVGADIQGALSGAKAGDVVCLSAGRYGDVTLTGISHSSNVTLAPTPGANVNLGRLTFVGPATSSNLTVQGFHINSGIAERSGTPGGLVFQYNTIENLPRGYAYYFYADGSSPGSYTQTGVKMLYNQIDHVGACLEVDGGNAMASNFTFSHNVCGPGIGAGASGASDASHYLQIGGITGFIAANNAFVGPMDPNYENAGLHNNVLHIFGDSSRIDFSNNVIWHAQSRGQTILLEEGRLDGVTINNNLDVEDPACDVVGNCAGYAIDVYNSHGLTVQSNTIVDSYWGVLLTHSEPMSYSDGANYNISRNVIVGTKGNPALSYGSCASACILDYNVSDDASAKQVGSTHFVTHWAAKWGFTSWAPATAHIAPPPGYYRATGLPWEAGYQGTIGP
jgi:hypothetical protein